MRRILQRLFFLSGLLAAAGLPGLSYGQTGVPLAEAPSSAQATTFGAERLRSALASDLSAHFRVDGDLQLELVRPWVAPDHAAAAWDVVIGEYPSALAPTLIVRCRILADGVAVFEDSVLLRASLWRDSWFTRQPVTAGSSFDPASLQPCRVDCLRDRDALPVSAGNRSFMFACDVGPDRMITWRDIVRRPLVRKGEVVEVVAADGPLVVTLKALALQNGGEGDLVTVRNLESLKDISGLVVAENRVRIEF
jgi:flagella basal body P-ring formation protein FlgA